VHAVTPTSFMHNIINPFCDQTFDWRWFKMGRSIGLVYEF